MKKVLISLCILLIILSISGRSAAIVFGPKASSDLWDLDHKKYYSWEIEWSIPAGKIISKASLSFKRIRNWEWEENHLYVNLLESAPGLSGMIFKSPDVWVGKDDQDEGNIFEGLGINLFDWTLPKYPAQNLTYTFNEAEKLALTGYLADGDLAFGFDPDCHYWNRGIEFKIETCCAPEPASLLLIIFGIIGLGVGLRKKH